MGKTKNLHKVPCAPKGAGACVFFTNINDPRLKETLETKGWIYEFYDPCIVLNEISLEDLRFSLKSKSVKFLQFFEAFPQYQNHDFIVYFDDRFHLTEKNIDTWFKLSSTKDECIIVRRSPKVKYVRDEIRESLHQPRYKINMEATKHFVFDRIKNDNGNDKYQICQTGLILYKMQHARTEVMQFVNTVFQTIMDLRQPQCQIIWCVIAHSFPGLVHIIQNRDLLKVYHQNGL